MSIIKDNNQPNNNVPATPQNPIHTKTQKKNTKWFLIGGGIIIFLCLIGFCLVQAYKIGTTSIQATAAQASIAVSNLPQATQIPATPIQPSSTITITNTLMPSSTPAPTNTPFPSFTPQPPTPLPKPITYSGSGDSVVNYDVSFVPALLDIQNSGSSNFVIFTYGADGEKQDLLINTIGSYKGRIMVDLYANQKVDKLEIKSDGKWKITANPLDSIVKIKSNDHYVGAGDDVIAIVGQASTAKFSTNTSSNFVVFGYSDNSSADLLVNEIAPYQGEIIIPLGTFILEIKCDGPWDLQLTSQ